MGQVGFTSWLVGSFLVGVVKWVVSHFLGQVFFSGLVMSLLDIMVMCGCLVKWGCLVG